MTVGDLARAGYSLALDGDTVTVTVGHQMVAPELLDFGDGEPPDPARSVPVTVSVAAPVHPGGDVGLALGRIVDMVDGSTGMPVSFVHVGGEEGFLDSLSIRISRVLAVSPGPPPDPPQHGAAAALDRSLKACGGGGVDGLARELARGFLKENGDLGDMGPPMVAALALAAYNRENREKESDNGKEESDRG